MTRDRRTLWALWLGGLFVTLGAFFVLQDRFRVVKGAVPEAKPAALPEVGQDVLSSLNGSGTGWPAPEETALSAPPPVPAAPPVTAQAEGRRARNIRFSYRSSKPARVEIVGSFNNWAPTPLVKGPNHTWTITYSLEPGEHTYNYLVDGKVVRDPNNPRTAAEGRSLLVVQPSS